MKIKSILRGLAAIGSLTVAIAFGVGSASASTG